jgi:hypothetical protein
MTRKKSLIIAFLLLLGQLYHFQTVVRTKGHTLTALNTDIRIYQMVQENGVNWTRFGALAAADTKFFLLNYAAILPLGECASGTRLSAGSGTTSKANTSLESGGQAAGRGNTDARLIPREKFVDLSRAGQRAGMAADTSLHPCSPESFHYASR